MRLTYELCEDWYIYARDEQGRLWYVVTELWPEWLDVPKEEWYKAGAVEKYMLPVAQARWNDLPWRLALEEE